MDQKPNHPEILIPEGWEFEGTGTIMGMVLDQYNTTAGCKCQVSKDYPPGLKGWHVSIGPRGKRKISNEVLTAEVQPLLDQLEVPFIFVWQSPRTGAMNYHEDIWEKKVVDGKEVRIGF